MEVGGFAGLPWCVDGEIKFLVYQVTDALQAFRRGEHIVLIGEAWTGGIKPFGVNGRFCLLRTAILD